MACSSRNSSRGPSSSGPGVDADTAAGEGWASVLVEVLSSGLLQLLHTEEAGRLGLASRRCVRTSRAVLQVTGHTIQPHTGSHAAPRPNLKHTQYRLQGCFLCPKALRASVQAAGPSDGARFMFWGHALRVRQVQRELLLHQVGKQGEGRQTDGDGGVLEAEENAEAAAAFQRALFGPQAEEEGGPLYSGKLSLSTEGQVRFEIER